MKESSKNLRERNNNGYNRKKEVKLSNRKERKELEFRGLNKELDITKPDYETFKTHEVGSEGIINEKMKNI